MAIKHWSMFVCLYYSRGKSRCSVFNAKISGLSNKLELFPRMLQVRSQARYHGDSHIYAIAESHLQFQNLS